MISIYAEATPNPHTMKFVANRGIYDGIIEFTDRESAKASPLAQQLFDFSCVASVFISQNFVTITKQADSDWYEIMPIIREFLKSYLEGTEPIVFAEKQLEKQEREKKEYSELELNSIEKQIADILEEYIKPAVEADGGAIQFRSFDNGKVTVRLQGSCSGCPSSTVTLKAGIENLLKRMVPDVEEVVAEND